MNSHNNDAYGGLYNGPMSSHNGYYMGEHGPAYHARNMYENPGHIYGDDIPSRAVYDSRYYQRQGSPDGRNPGEHKVFDPSKTKSPETLAWIIENFEEKEGSSMPRCHLFELYQNYCEQNSKIVALNPASFGKLIKAAFPMIKTRRLGTRGQSKYHYFGITFKPDSPYHSLTAADFSNDTDTGIGGNCDIEEAEDQEDEKEEMQYDYSTPLNSQPTPLTMCKMPIPVLPEEISLDFNDFVTVYHHHFETILKSISMFDVNDIAEIFNSFYKNLDPRFRALLVCEDPCITKVIEVYDNLLYDVIAVALIPNDDDPESAGTKKYYKNSFTLSNNIAKLMTPLMSSTTQYARFIAKNIQKWYENALMIQFIRPAGSDASSENANKAYPRHFLRAKLEIADRFALRLKRHTSLNHLIQAAKAVLANDAQVKQMLEDWVNVDFYSIYRQVVWSANSASAEISCSYVYHVGSSLSEKNNKDYDSAIFESTMIKLKEDFQCLISNKVPLKNYLDWLYNLCQEYVNNNSHPHGNRKQVDLNHAEHYLLLWSMFNSLVMRDLTLRSAPSFGSFHLIRLLFDEYILQVLEILRFAELDQNLYDTIKWTNRN